MGRVLYFDCFSGISGDMVLGALLDAGLPLTELRGALGSLTLNGVDIEAAPVLRAGVAATKFSVREPGSHSHDHHHDRAEARRDRERDHPHDHGDERDHAHGHDHGHSHSHGHDHSHDHGHSHKHDHGHGHEAHEHRSLPEIFSLIDGSALSPSGRERAKALFQRLAEAEAAIHRMPVERVHLHEVGAIDSIVDIVGAVYGLERMGVDRFVCSPLNVGSGMVDSAHGHFPVPAPATLRLLTASGAPIYNGTLARELVTPTGALIATSYATSFGPIPAMTIARVGYGAGDADPAATPNVLRVVLGDEAQPANVERVTVVECEIDDMNPQLFGVVMDRLYAAGALEVFYVPAQMKKNRPGTLLTVVGRPEDRRQLADIIFRETTTIGVRYVEVDRECLVREVVEVQTPLGPVRFKLAWRDGRLVNSAPEFDDCARIAASRNLSVKEVQAVAVQAYGAGASNR